MAIKNLLGIPMPKQHLEFGVGSIIIDDVDNHIDHGVNFARWSGTGTTTAANGVTITQGAGNSASLTVPLQANGVYWCRARYAARTSGTCTIRVVGSSGNVGPVGDVTGNLDISATIDAVTNRVYFRLQADATGGPHTVYLTMIGGSDGNTLRFDEFNIFPNPPTEEVIYMRGDCSSSYNATEGRDIMNAIRGNTAYVAPYPQHGYPKFILTTGDNGDPSAGQFYPDTWGPLKTWCDQRGVFVFPGVGNHDYTMGMPGFQSFFKCYPPSGLQTWSCHIGQIDFFFVDAVTMAAQSTDPATARATADGQELLRLLQQSNARFKILIGHYPAYVSVNGYAFTEMRWNWWSDYGVCAYLSGHAHVYERIHQQTWNGFPSLLQIVCGRGGSTAAGWGTLDSGSQVRIAAGGYMRIYDGVRGNAIWFEYMDVNHNMVDRVKVTI